MKVTYVGHSGYMAEENGTVLIFDYYKGKLSRIPMESEIYVFASHVHPDHFNKKILEWKKKYPNIHYILSDDIKLPKEEEKVLYIGPCQEKEIGGLKIRTLRSTDEGVAFFIRMHGKVIYHGGDLNWWHWKEESADYNRAMQNGYQHEIHRIEGERIDAAFLPLDPRQEEQYSWGFDYFMRHTDTEHAFPMHMWGQYDICGRLLQDPVSKPYRDRIKPVEKPLQEFEI